MSANDTNRESMVALTLDALLEMKRNPTVSVNDQTEKTAAQQTSCSPVSGESHKRPSTEGGANNGGTAEANEIEGGMSCSRVPIKKRANMKQDKSSSMPPPPPSAPKDTSPRASISANDGSDTPKIMTQQPPTLSPATPSQQPLDVLAPRGGHTMSSSTVRPEGRVSVPSPYATAGMVHHHQHHHLVAYSPFPRPHATAAPTLQMVRNMRAGLTAAAAQGPGAPMLPLAMPGASHHPSLHQHASTLPAQPSHVNRVHPTTQGPIASPARAAAHLPIQGGQPLASQGYVPSPVPIAAASPVAAQSGRNVSASPVASNVTSSSDGQGSGAAASSVRSEEVAAALRSKPQRGKKRENLTPTERQELTRTRNREHARSTRIRKKARYDELVSNEGKYLELKAKQDLSEARKQCVVNFFEIRASMMKDAASRHSAKPPQGTSSSSAQLEPSSEEAPPPVLKDVLDNAWHFEVSVMGLEGGDAQHGVAAMRELDLRIVDFVASRHGGAAVSTLRFRDAYEGIAIGANDVGFAQVELVVKPKDGTAEEIVMSITSKFKFVSDSSKIHSLAWSSPTAPTFVSRPTNVQARSQGDDSPEKKQGIFPTVVSFDNSSPADNAGLPLSRTACAVDGTNSNVDQSPGPGMNI